MSFIIDYPTQQWHELYVVSDLSLSFSNYKDADNSTPCILWLTNTKAISRESTFHFEMRNDKVITDSSGGHGGSQGHLFELYGRCCVTREVSVQTLLGASPRIRNWVSTHDDVIKLKTFSALLALCAGISPITGEFPSQRPVTRSFDVFYPRLNKQLSKQTRCRWFETQSRSLWRHCN